MSAGRLSMARRAVRLYPRQPWAARSTTNALRRGWMRQVKYLGPRWLLADSMPRLDCVATVRTDRVDVELQ